MKIHPPKITIDESDPFYQALFGRKEFGESLTRLLRNVPENIVVVVHAPWGEGKTTFAEMWRADLRLKNLDAIYFDAYASDYFDDPFVSFCGEIVHFIKQKLPNQKELLQKTEFKKKAIAIGKRLAGVAVKVALKSATLGALDETSLKELKDINDDIATDLSKAASEAIEKKIESYAAEKDTLAAFKKSLAAIASAVRTEQGFPLTIIVDELDRCRPAFALSLLERIKHLFDVENLAFVLLVNRDQLESYIKTVYGSVDSHGYLLKFANVFVDLPHQAQEFQHQHQDGRPEYVNKLFNHYGLAACASNIQLLRASLETLADHFLLTLREIEKVLTIITLFYSSAPNTQRIDDFLMAMLAVLKVHRPQLYARLRAGSVQKDVFFAETRLDNLKSQDNRYNIKWTRKILHICLMSETELSTAKNNERNEPDSTPTYSQLAETLPSRREQIIPLHCSRLDRFSVQP